MNKLNAEIKIKSWWVDWWRDGDHNWFCAIIEVNKEQFQYIERELI